MKPIRLVGIGGSHKPLLDALRPALAWSFGVPVEVSARVLDPAGAYQPERDQYHSTPLVEALRAFADADQVALGVTAVDLFVPILTYVFGEAEVEGRAALVSYRRLQQPFYGLPDDPHLLFERLLKEAVHELGHVAGLSHCDDYDCVMASSHGVEWIDLKTAAFCHACHWRAVAAPVSSRG